MSENEWKEMKNANHSFQERKVKARNSLFYPTKIPNPNIFNLKWYLKKVLKKKYKCSKLRSQNQQIIFAW